MLSYIFVFMIVISVVCSVIFSSTQELSQSMLDGASEAVELLVMMSGMMCLWSGVMEVARKSRLTDKLAKLFSPLLKKLFPDVKKDSKAFQYICMNVSANLLGLSNAATPFGLSAMKELKKDLLSDEASDSMVTFVVMNTASIQLLPTNVATMRSVLGSTSPFDIIFCVWVTSVIALTVGLTVSRLCSKIGRKKWNL
ncbi:MAG: spore maturation protein A [Ruminococcaceae bacterium]|nr:spore maturation protein A [Oscillospiraceae bacterium]